jgi:hypothetical protein
VVVREESGRSELTVSLKRAQLGLAWQRLRQAQGDEAVLRGKVVAVNRGGLLVDLEGVRGFCPGSQLAQVRTYIVGALAGWRHMPCLGEPWCPPTATAGGTAGGTAGHNWERRACQRRGVLIQSRWC